MPVLESAITLIQDGRLYYRGYDALALALRCSVEEVAALIWLDRLDPGALFAHQDLRPHEVGSQQEPLTGRQNPIELYQATLARAAVDDLAAYVIAPEAVAATGAHILESLVAVTTGSPVSLSLAHSLQVGWAPQQPEVADLLSTALVLCADHELNVSAFTARCVASAGSTPYAVVIAGLAALQGHRHGGHTEQVARLLREARTGITSAVAGYLRQGAPVPGFGHPLYPGGDPRGRLLLELVGDRYPETATTTLAGELCRAVYDLTELRPTVDFALEILTQTLGLPPRATLALFALGRTIGWIGHAIEQYAMDQLIRPRARYVGSDARQLPQ